MPIDIKTEAMTRSITRNGTNRRNPIQRHELDDALGEAGAGAEIDADVLRRGAA
jgi:hypothetical protein